MKTPGLYKGKIPDSAAGGDPRWIKWVPFGTIAGGVTASFAAFTLHHRDFAIGLGWGSLFTVVNFYSLKILTEKVLGGGPQDGKKIFWFWNTIRWCFLALGCWGFLSVSPVCLAGAAASYFWFLLVLGWAGWRFAAASPTDKSTSKFF